MINEHVYMNFSITQLTFQPSLILKLDKIVHVSGLIWIISAVSMKVNFALGLLGTIVPWQVKHFD